jgi:hypothetical protein
VAAKIFVKVIVFAKTLWPIVSDDKYSKIDKDLKLAIQARDCQHTLAGAAVGTATVCQFPGSPSLKIYLQARAGSCLGF